MKVILTAAVQNLGKIGDIVSVKNGYAKNFLVPKKKAIYLTANNQKLFELKKSQFEQENAHQLSAAEAIRNDMIGKDVIVIENASDDGRLYGSVNSQVIADTINKILRGKSVDRADIFLAKPIKEIGVYQVSLKPHSDVGFEVRLVVSRSESEVEAMINPKGKGSKAEATNSEAEGEESQPKKRARKPKKEESEEVSE